MAGQTLLQTSNFAAQQLLILKILALAPTAASAATGLAFGAAGALNSLAAVTYTTVTRRRLGYLGTVIAASLLMGIVIAASSVLDTVTLVVVSIAALGLLQGVMGPAISSIGLEAPPRIQGQVYGVSASALALGLGIGPVLGGGIAATAGIPIALLSSAGISFLIPTILRIGGREPTR
jgi:MFS family permease